MIRSLFACLLCWLTITGVHAQDTTRVVPTTTTADTTRPATQSADDLLGSLTDSIPSAPLLPDHMLISQRLFWGKNGLMRITNASPLTAEGRSHELKIRRTMLKLHQIGGFVTLAGFVAQGIIGSQLYKAGASDYRRLKDLHESMATAINISYATTALLSLTSPPPAVGQRRGLSTIKLHKYLAIVHMAGMIATNILAGQISENAALKPYHRAAAYTTFGAFATAIIVLKF
ncbi:hypothetical protein [Fibrivirga algicola]|uniref:Cytochrome b561 domain-containing protein n=1 Tax=Fibrivirga algicola TaxID=2950420 RepID=A0ABX0QGN3_9BACT|nr:hypothetical protein [Fibrivirga algicola]ARK09973.1 hypothetical protein A6C57_06250 [Fibrella sp. ES10-3-2-2]NID11591.1 hypothetical protein [Fibrivirga algicola]